MNTKVLEQIGLTKSEIKVYLALLDIGISSTGKIVDKSGTASSKVYEILDKLIQKGLVSYIIRSGVKYFEAADPKRLNDYMQDKRIEFTRQENELNSLIPLLELKKKLSDLKSEATVYKGLKGAETAFKNMINSMKKEDEWMGFIVSFQNQRYSDLLLKLHKLRVSKKLRSRILWDELDLKEGEIRRKLPYTQVKYIPNIPRTPAIINVAGDITLINLMSKEVTVFEIENKEVAESFKNQFEQLWNQQVHTAQGQNAVESMYSTLVKNVKKDDEILVFAAKPKTNRCAEFNLRWNKEIRKKVKAVKLLYYGISSENKQRAKEISSAGCEVKIIPTDQTLPISTVISGDIILNSIWEKEPITLRIKNKIVADSLRTNFKMLWDQEVRIIKGIGAVEQIFEDMLNYSSADFISARGYFVDKRPSYIKKWESTAKKTGFRMRNIVDKTVNGHKITKFSFAKTKYTLPKEFADLSVFWIYGEKVVISNWTGEEPIVTIIENKRIHDVYKKQFELLWNRKII